MLFRNSLPRSLCPWWSLALLCLTVTGSRSLAAQSFDRGLGWGASVGLAFQTTSLDGHLAGRGPVGAAFVRFRATPLLGVTLEALAAHFSVRSDHIHGPCAPDVGPFECHPPVGSLTVGAIMGGIQWGESTQGERTYLLLGGGFYRALNHPTAQGATRPGWTAGLSFTLTPVSPHLSLEVRYHRVPGWPEETLDLI